MVGILDGLIIAASLIGTALLSEAPGPGGQSQGQSQSQIQAPLASATEAASYVVGPGDVLEVTVLDQSEVSRSTTVQPNGRFTMPLLGDIDVAGKTVAQIQKLITELLARDFLVNPRVEVRVREFASQFALVLGEIVSPGRRSLRGNTRLIDLLIESGGFRPGASGEVLVQRTEGTFPNGEKSIRFRLGNTAGMTEDDRLNAELVLRNGDVVTASPKYYVTVDGEVSRPGRIVIENDLTLLGVIAESGGLGKFGSSTVRIIRKKAEGVDLASFGPCEGATLDVCREVDIKAIRKGKVQDLLMAPNDKVVVSRRRF
jgi:polysaccharide export outer membrane protein